MKSCLIMITSGFPFGSAETYIESEIDFLKDRFDKIIILPVELDPGAAPTRTVPQGVEYYNVSVRKQKIARMGDTIGGLKNLVSPTDYYKWDRVEIGSDLRKRMFFEYFCNRAIRSYGECLRTLKKIDMSDYDSITVYSYWFFVTALVGVMLKEYFGTLCDDVKLFSRAHRYDVYENMNALNYLPLRRYLLENCDGIFPCSDSGTEHIASRYPEYADKIKTSYLGTADYGISYPSESGLHIVSCSQMIDVKRVDRIIDILQQLDKSERYKIEWTHIGDGNRRREIERKARIRLETVKTNFLGGIANSEVYDFYRNNPVDLFISTSRSEGLPVSMMEAASFGIPIISTDVGGVKEIVEDGYNGYLLNENASPEEFADYIRRFYDKDKAEKAVFRKNSRTIWENRFDARKTYSEMFSAPMLSRS